MKKIRNEGFSIVEISLVLAIAGLIFIMTFIALPALQKSERDTERRESVIKFIDTLKKYQENTRGSLPSDTSGYVEGLYLEDNTKSTATSWASFYKDYFTDNFVDASGNKFNWKIYPCEKYSGGVISVGELCEGILDDEFENINVLDSKSKFEDNNTTMHIITGATCDGSLAVKSANPRKVAVLYVMERVGVYCNNT